MSYFNYNEPVFRPPSEARSLILQITIGCSQNQCKFCGMYKMKTFALRRVADIAAEIEMIPQEHRNHYQRIFLADGDALVYPQQELIAILDLLKQKFPNLNRVGIYASPKSLTTKDVAELQQLKLRKLRILYFGLESGDALTLQAVNKGYSPDEMLHLCRKAQAAGLKLSVTAILGLAGRGRSHEHALATAKWINQLSPEYFSLLTLFQRHNDAYFAQIEPLSNEGILEEALTLVQHLRPHKTILRSNHVSNMLNLAGSYPKDRERIIMQTEATLEKARSYPDWCAMVPDYGEAYF
ncbi:Fe-S oxidoreductase [Desulfuromusa kysingii]|uniref:Fe-S oxidoreductase n=1 Tax=Desulfuromusa kysingii TaxID=37625 RepID=A0A1H3WD72_9BACT|nr:radical SAM protein [Desulfuromusa kysingii]SDZ85069.1 Fe-S oxidoreductase [Desulfuromusa kysingii]